MPDSQYMVMPTVTTRAVGRQDNPRLLNVRTGQRCRWQDLPENGHAQRRGKPPQRRTIIPVELLERGGACKVKCDNRWHRGRIWFFSECDPRVWVVVYPYRNSPDPAPFPLLVDLNETVIGLPGDGATAPGRMPGWAK